jgi:hypothetical protein
MALKPILIDSNFLYALFDKKDIRHEQATKAIAVNQSYVTIEGVLVESLHLIRIRRGHQQAFRMFASLLNSKIEILALTQPDFLRAREIMATYAESRFDFVDCCLMALSERLNITDILTFDRRDFVIFRPNHVGHLTLLP